MANSLRDTGFRCIAAHKNLFHWKRFGRQKRISLASKMLVSFSGRVRMRILITTAMFSALAFTPASAAMMACTGENMAKTTHLLAGLQEGLGMVGMG
jgi:hypothetical protein